MGKPYEVTLLSGSKAYIVMDLRLEPFNHADDGSYTLLCVMEGNSMVGMDTFWVTAWGEAHFGNSHHPKNIVDFGEFDQENFELNWV